MPNLNRLRFWPKFKARDGLATGSESGQVIIEYILLLVVALSLAAIIMKAVVSRDQEGAGFLMKRWQGLLNQIGNDDPNKRGP